jgi:hypothetical protein
MCSNCEDANGEYMELWNLLGVCLDFAIEQIGRELLKHHASFFLSNDLANATDFFVFTYICVAAMSASIV